MVLLIYIKKSIMNKWCSFLSFLLLFLSLSCIESENHVYSLDNNVSKNYRSHRESLTKSIISNISNGVTESDVEAYLNYSLNISSHDIKDITRYDILNDSYIFIVNLDKGGWLFISGDYSAPPVLASCDEGSYYSKDKLSKHDEALFLSMRHLMQECKVSKSQEAEENRKIWIRSQLLRNGRDRFVLDSGGSDTIEVDIQCYNDTIYNDDYPQLTSTTWWQDEPFNGAMPLLNNTGERCFTGCAVIAIAQLLYYTHYTFGFPNDLYSNASCSSFYYDNPYVFNFSNPSSVGWNNMPTSWLTAPSTEPYSAALCALISQRSGTVYDSNGEGSTAHGNVPGTLSSFLLTGTSDQDFFRPTIISEIQNNRPVLCSGQIGSESHSYLVEGYQWFYVVETEVVTDMSGNVISQQQNVIVNNFFWRINTGAPGHINVAEGSYYPLYRRMFVGWTQ